MDWFAMATEWAKELSKLKAPYQIVSIETAWGFMEVERGRNPDIVLKEVLTRIAEKHAEWKEGERNASPSQRPN